MQIICREYVCIVMYEKQRTLLNMRQDEIECLMSVFTFTSAFMVTNWSTINDECFAEDTTR